MNKKNKRRIRDVPRSSEEAEGRLVKMRNLTKKT